MRSAGCAGTADPADWLFNPAPPEPPLARPTTTPCTVTLFANMQFADYSDKAISYTPGCTGPWSKVILTADFTVTAGRQFDRTAKLFLGGANIYFGTTAEPRAALAPSWHAERDVTDLSVLFTKPEVGVATVQNIVNSTYTGIIYGTATLQFYPANAANPAPVVPTAAIALTNNATARLNTTTDLQTATLTLPRNIERAYLDVIAQSQSDDEFWYTCVPSDVAGALQNCGNTGFRETEVTIDGAPAGVAPIYPWIYTGGLDPYLWEPITGIETLSFKPYRVDLTPFAGKLSDGQTHTVAVSVFNASNGFEVASTLLLYTDANSASTSGAVTSNTLSATPNVQVQESLNTAGDGTVSGPVTVTSRRDWTISGYVNTSHGRVDTTIKATNFFTNQQDEKVSDAEYKQNLTQTSTQQEIVTTASSTGVITTQHDVSFPLVLNYRQSYNGSGGLDIPAYVKQQKDEAFRSPLGANSPNPVVSHESVETMDTLHYSGSFALLGHDTNSSNSQFGSKDELHRCVYRVQASNMLFLTQEDNGTSCSMAP